VMRRAIETDQALRGRGTPKKDVPTEAGLAHTKAAAAIHRLTRAHMAIIAAAPVEVPKSLFRRLGDAVNVRPGAFGFSIDIKKLLGWEK